MPSVTRMRTTRGGVRSSGQPPFGDTATRSESAPSEPPPVPNFAITASLVSDFHAAIGRAEGSRSRRSSEGRRRTTRPCLAAWIAAGALAKLQCAPTRQAVRRRRYRRRLKTRSRGKDRSATRWRMCGGALKAGIAQCLQRHPWRALSCFRIEDSFETAWGNPPDGPIAAVSEWQLLAELV